MARYNYEFDMKYTDNPYIDLIVNSVKILGMNAVVKNENQALHYEDTRSSTLASQYIKFKEGNWNFAKDGDYSESSYMEWNSYYRMLNGLPPAYTLNDENAYFQATGYDNSIYEDIGCAYVIPELYEKYFIDVGQYDEKYQGKYLHELDMEDLSVISVKGGILDQIKADYADDSHYQYIYHLGDKRVDYYTARKAVNFAMLYLPELNTFDIIENKFRRVYDRNRKYTMSTVYSEAYRFMSYHYDAFIQILIIIQTMVDLISEVQEYIINKDVFDSRTIRYLFESYGIAYYKEIPTKYQIRIIKNVNKLLKYKSSHRNIIDILELFDDDTITVFTHYLMKIKDINRDDFYYYTENDINPRYINNERLIYIGRPEDITNNKVPIMDVDVGVDETEVITDPVTGKTIKDNFIKTHIYNYYLEPGYKDKYGNRKINESLPQPIASKYAEGLSSLESELDNKNNSFILDFLDNTAIIHDKNWFAAETYNKNPLEPLSTEYLKKRNIFLNRFKIAITNIIKVLFYEETKTDSIFALNRFNYRRVKYKLYSILGIFNYENIDFENTTDAELLSRFYTSDRKVEMSDISKHNIPKEFVGTFLLNHTIPFMEWNKYQQNDKSPVSEYISDASLYIFNSTNSFLADRNKLGDLYDVYTKSFRETFIASTRIFVEAVFDDLAYDPIDNPTPRYSGWMDISQVVAKTGKPIDALRLSYIIGIRDGDNVPIYKSSYINEVVTEDMIGMEYYRKNYDLCFLKVPILDPNAYKVIERKDHRRSYDSITLADPFWDGVSTFDILTDEERDRLHQSKKRDILRKEFTIERTKYIAVEANIDLVKMSYQVSYFMNMLYDKHIDEENLMVEVDPEISNEKVRLNDLLTFAIALNFIYNGTEPDNIASDMEKNMYINGFNFDTDWTTIYNYLENKHFINGNYDNEIHEYTYVNEFGESITNVGYGMTPTKKGWMSELYDDTITYYSKDGEEIAHTYSGLPIYGKNENGDPIYFYEDEINKPTGDPINQRTVDHSQIPNPAIGAFLSGRYEKCNSDCVTTKNMGLDFGESEIWSYNLKNHVVIDAMQNLRTINIAWEPTQYPDTDNNSHGLWLDTEILNTLNDEKYTDLDRINMLKKIYCTNTNLYNHLTYMLRHAESKRMYDIYKILFDSFMETKMNHEYYSLIDINGNPVYADEKNEKSLYYLTPIETVECDEYGYPIFKGLNLHTNMTKTYEFDYNRATNTNFEECYYRDRDGSDTYECFYYMKNGTKEYVVHNDEQNQIGRDTYFMPQSTYHFFSFNVITTNYLVSKDNPDIKIEIDVDDNGVPILNPSVKYIITKNESGKYIVTKVDKSYPTPSGSTDVVITRKIAESYYDFLEFRNPSLYAHLIDLKYNYDNVPVSLDENQHATRYVPSDEKRKRIETLCEYIAVALEKYFDKKEWRYIFNLIPTTNIQNIQSYIMKMVMFFKSWKTQILDTTVSYVIDDPFNNHVHIIDDMYMSTSFNLLEKIRPKDYKYFENHTTYKDPVRVREEIDLKETYLEPYTIDFGFAEKMYGHNFDYPNLTSKLVFKDKISPGEKVEMNIVYFTGEAQLDSNGNILLP